MNECTLESMDRYILESLQQAVPMLRNAARRCNLDFDDLYQEAYLTLRSSLPRVLAANHPRAYIHTMFRMLAYQLVRQRNQRREAISLDCVCGEDENVTRADLIADPDPEPEAVAILEEQTAVLYEALHRLPASWQAEVHLYYELEQFEVCANSRLQRVCTATNNKAKNALRCKAYQELRRDPALREAVQV